MTPIENRILLSELKSITKKSELKHLINFTIAEGLEGLVLKVNAQGMATTNETSMPYSRIPTASTNRANATGSR